MEDIKFSERDYIDYGAIMITYNEETYSLLYWSNFFDIDPYNLYQRLRSFQILKAMRHDEPIRSTSILKG